MLFKEIKNLYPISQSLASKIVNKIEGHPAEILDGQAGKGTLIEALQNSYKLQRHRINYKAIEIEPELQSVLRGKNIKVIDSDFLNFQGPDKFDLVVGNPPFDDGHKHLLKAIDILYRGQIIYVINAETLKNPYSSSRKALVRKLDELGADIEYISNAFLDAERTTPVQVALISIVIDRKVEDDLFAGTKNKAPKCEDEFKESFELSTGRTIYELVAEYNHVVKTTTETIINYYRNYRTVSNYVGLNCEAKENKYSGNDLTMLLQGTVNNAVKEIRVNFWRQTLDLKEVNKRLTAKKQDEFHNQLTKQSDMDFTASNIHAFILNIINSHQRTITETVVELFDYFTRHAYEDSPREKNIHLFNGWKTNDSFKVKKKVILPFHASGIGSAFVGWSNQWQLDYGVERIIRDIDLVMSYFDGMKSYKSTCEALKEGFENGENRNLESTYFTVTAYIKGTLHLIFKDEDILRRFNVAACIGKGWLPENYGKESYVKMLPEQRDVVDSFEGCKKYEKNLPIPLYPLVTTQLKLAA